ncbi:hypothetical protein N7539_000299 [Penicillium diatomitis]|uniref:CN hydrolase domain-containing protein n=1 Tax=Penicillium diatomitis TaxID=2819901 RepID=A0A9W9XLH2_9EURO|nr:uncharacterized protein N7539_000299 [Penicillium diatomitis]KAJ5495183.1 hypothetical protein N7539_000299 [Penicillium diatomitis]
MRIATLQFAPKLGDVEGNIKRANDLLGKQNFTGLQESSSQELSGRGDIDFLRPDLLVLPELAFTGYNFTSREAIEPFLEQVGDGPSAQWAREIARRLHCKVCVGYPEIEHSSDGSGSPKYYNSLLVVDESGSVIHNYRKSFLYMTDETWATEGDVALGLCQLPFPSVGSSEIPENRSQLHREDSGPRRQVATSFGICMDINPYKFEAPYSAYEFANRARDSGSQLVVLSMAWLTHMSQQEMTDLRGRPDMDTFTYWLNRFMPLISKKMRHVGDIDGSSASTENGVKRAVLVFANRAGEEAGADDTKPVARYAGTSTIMALTQNPRKAAAGARSASGSPEKRPAAMIDPEEASEDEDEEVDTQVVCWDLLGAAEEGICFADTTAVPKMAFRLRSRGGQSDSDEMSDQ